MKKFQAPWGVVEKKKWNETKWTDEEEGKKFSEASSDTLKKLKDKQGKEWNNEKGFDNIYPTKKEQEVEKVIKEMKAKGNPENLWAVVFNEDLTKTETEAVFTYEELTKSTTSTTDLIQQLASKLITK